MVMKYANLGSRFQASMESRGCEDDAANLIPGGADSMEASLLEAQQVEAEVAENEQALDEAQDVAAGLEAIANDLEAFVKDGGLDAKGAVMMQRAVNAYTSRLGFAKAPVASVESFGGATSRITATTASLEGIKEIIRNVWEWIKKQINAVRTKLKDYWLKNYAVAPRLSKRAEAIRAKATAAASKTIKKGEKVTLSAEVKALHVNKAFPTDLAAAYSDVKAVAENVFNTTSKATLDAAEAYADMVNKMAFKDDAEFGTSVQGFVNANNAIRSKVVGSFSTLTVDAGDTRYNDREVFGSKEVMGGQRVVITYTKAGAANTPKDAVDKLVSVTAGMMPVRAKEDTLRDEVSIDPLPTSKITSICDEIIGVADLVAKYAQGYANHERAKDALLKAGEAFNKEASACEELSAANNTLAKRIVDGISAYSKLVDQPMVGFSGYVLRTSAAVLNVCEKSLALYE